VQKEGKTSENNESEITRNSLYWVVLDLIWERSKLGEKDQGLPWKRMTMTVALG